MPVRIAGGGGGLGALLLHLFDSEWVSDPEYNQGSIAANWGGFGYQRGGTPYPINAGNPSAVWTTFGTIPTIQKAGMPETWGRMLTGAGGASGSLNLFRPQIFYGLDFFDQLSPELLAAGNPGPVAYELYITLKKINAGDIPTNRMWFGALNVTDVTNLFARRACMCGLMGDGGGGFQFGSVNTPTADNNPADNGQSTVVVGPTVNPPELANPGTNAFGIKIKVVPPVPGVSGGQIACYFPASTRRALYTNTVNFPRNSVSNIDVTNADYFGVQLGFAVFPNPDNVTVDPGIFWRDLRVKITQDTSV